MSKRVVCLSGAALLLPVVWGLSGGPLEYAGVPVTAQSQRQVQTDIALRTQPVVITRVTLGGSTVQYGRFVRSAAEAPDPITPFTGDDEWIKGLTVFFLNRTNRTIVRAQFMFSFPETTAGRNRAAFSLTLGRLPDVVSVDKGGKFHPQPPELQPINFGPGQTMPIHLADYIDQIKAAVGPDWHLESLTQVNVTMPGFYFSDGTMYAGGYRTFDPQSAAWQRLGADYFPGNMDRYWPGSAAWVDRE